MLEWIRWMTMNRRRQMHARTHARTHTHTHTHTHCARLLKPLCPWSQLLLPRMHVIISISHCSVEILDIDINMGYIKPKRLLT